MSEELIITRELNAPRDLVWKVWTDPQHLARWWGPAGFQMAVVSLDLRVGGIFLYSQTAPGAGQPMWGKIVYDEVSPVERLVFRSSFADETGATKPNPWAPAWPLEIRNTLTLTAHGGKTLLVLRGQPFQAAPEGEKLFAENRHNVNKGFEGTFAQLEAYLSQTLASG